MSPPRRLQKSGVRQGDAIAKGGCVPKNEVESRLLLDVVITQCPTILELLSCKNKALLIWRNAEHE